MSRKRSKFLGNGVGRFISSNGTSVRRYWRRIRWWIVRGGSMAFAYHFSVIGKNLGTDLQVTWWKSKSPLAISNSLTDREGQIARYGSLVVLNPSTLLKNGIGQSICLQGIQEQRYKSVRERIQNSRVHTAITQEQSKCDASPWKSLGSNNMHPLL